MENLVGSNIGLIHLISGNEKRPCHGVSGPGMRVEMASNGASGFCHFCTAGVAKQPDWAKWPKNPMHHG
jgi:hypothetical protein